MKRLAILVVIACGSRANAGDALVANLDLRNFGYRFTGSTPIFADYTDLNFLSDDLLLVSINQRSFGRPVEPSFSDSPDSTIVLFDLKSRRVVASAAMAVEKSRGSVQAISGKRFAVLNEKGIAACSVNLQCGLPIESKGPVFVSPHGERLAEGGNGQTPRKVIDTVNWRQVVAFQSRLLGRGRQEVIPGDDAILIQRGGQVIIQRSGAKEAAITIDSKGTFSESRFLSAEQLAYPDWIGSAVVVMNIDGKEIRRYGVSKIWRTGILPTGSGRRFGIYEYGYTLLNSIVYFFDIDDGRPMNFQRVRVVDLISGMESPPVEWDPRPFLSRPALSPSGHLLARVKRGILEVIHID